jgi:hypothetical protein
MWENNVTITQTNSGLLIEGSYGAAITRIINIERKVVCSVRFKEIL